MSFDMKMADKVRNVLFPFITDACESFTFPVSLAIRL